MNKSNRALIIVALYLIMMGVFFTALMLVPGVSLDSAWPTIFIVLGITLCLPPFIWPSLRAGLAALIVPGTMVVVLGLLFQYTVLADDWTAWLYAWLLVPASFGLGLMIASKAGGWSKGVTYFGLGVFILFAVAFGLFATLLGTITMKVLGVVLLILSGIFLLAAAISRARTKEERKVAEVEVPVESPPMISEEEDD